PVRPRPRSGSTRCGWASRRTTRARNRCRGARTPAGAAREPARAHCRPGRRAAARRARARGSDRGGAWPWPRKGSTGPSGFRRGASANRPALDSTYPPAEVDLIDIDALVSANIGPIVGGLVIVVLALAFAVVGLIRRVRGLNGRLESLTQGSDAASLEGVLGSHLERVNRAVSDVETVAARTAVLEHDQQGSIGRVGLVRVNPFEDTGGNQSFALAMLDGRGDGFVVSSLHARAGTRVYAKSIAGGAAESALSDEEGEALQLALAKRAAGGAA